MENTIEEIIQLHSEDVPFEHINPMKVKKWLNTVVEQEGRKVAALSFIFCSDDYLHKINVQYLDHDTLTDVITFQYSEGKTSDIEGDIFISIDRIRENAKSFGNSFEDELHRVMIHGTLHLLGYLDKTAEDKTQMTQKENEYLTKLNGMKLDNQ